jgi:hypothetical protein
MWPKNISRGTEASNGILPGTAIINWRSREPLSLYLKKLAILPKIPE